MNQQTPAPPVSAHLDDGVIPPDIQKTTNFFDTIEIDAPFHTVWELLLPALISIPGFFLSFDFGVSAAGIWADLYGKSFTGIVLGFVTFGVSFGSIVFFSFKFFLTGTQFLITPDHLQFRNERILLSQFRGFQVHPAGNTYHLYIVDSLTMRPLKLFSSNPHVYQHVTYINRNALAMRGVGRAPTHPPQDVGKAARAAIAKSQAERRTAPESSKTASPENDPERGRRKQNF